MIIALALIITIVTGILSYFLLNHFYHLGTAELMTKVMKNLVVFPDDLWAEEKK